MDTTITAQVLPVLQAVAASPVHWVIALVIGALLSTWGHALVSKIIDSSKNPLVHFFAPAVLGMVSAYLTQYLGATFGVTPGDATLAWATFTGLYPTLKALGLTGLQAGAAGAQQVLSNPQSLDMLAVLATGMGEPEVAAVLQALSAARTVSQSATEQAPQGAPAPAAAPQAAVLAAQAAPAAVDPRP